MLRSLLLSDCNIHRAPKQRIKVNIIIKIQYFIMGLTWCVASDQWFSLYSLLNSELYLLGYFTL